SGIYYVAVLTQYRPHSLNDHVGIGKPWDLDRMKGGIRLLQPFVGRRDSDWYRGTADAVYQNLPFLADWRWDLCLVLSGDHIYKMDYTPMIAFHQDRRAEATVAVMEVPIEEAHRFGTLVSNAEGQVIRFEEKPPRPSSNLISMGVYVFQREALERRLAEDAQRKDSAHDFGRSIIPRMVEHDRVFAYPFTGYWRDVGTVHSYWEANMGLLKEPPDIDLYDSNWVIHTRSEERPPALVTERASIRRSLVSHGCIVNGTVERSVLSPGVFVAEGAVVRDSIVMMDAIIGSGSVVDRAILDKQVVVGTGCVIGDGRETPPNRTEPRNLTSGITIVGKQARIPSGVRLGRNVKVGSEVLEKDFASALADGRVIPSGETIEVRS
ncbi:MAG: glucose-1-phosphate adenylyltransferase, partial [Chloroflexi bacterium]|nr:glucose-1-phosphate adenylyltransferase [Chloroflexota bacterium]